jgi:hypothetical protein
MTGSRAASTRKEGSAARCVGLLVLALTLGGCSWCRNDLRAEVVAPGGAVKAVVFDRDCGGAVATAWGPQVAVMGPEERLDAHETVGDLFTARVREGVAFGDTLVRVEWRSDTTLVLRHDPRLDVRFAVKRLGRLNVEYEPWSAADR